MKKLILLSLASLAIAITEVVSRVDCVGYLTDALADRELGALRAGQQEALRWKPCSVSASLWTPGARLKEQVPTVPGR